MKPSLPATEAEWEHLTGALVKAHLKIAGMDYADLKAALSTMGIEQSTTNISAKLNRGRFSSVFLLQALVAIGVTELSLPTRGGA